MGVYRAERVCSTETRALSPPSPAQGQSDRLEDSLSAMRYVDRKRTANDLVHRKARGAKPAEPEQPLETVIDHLAAALVAAPDDPPPPRAESDQPIEAEVAQQVEAAIAVDDLRLETEAERLEVERYEAELDAIEQQKLDAERLGAQREVVQDLRSRIETGQAQLEAVRKQTASLRELADEESNRNSELLESLQAELAALASEAERQRHVAKEQVAERTRRLAAFDDQISDHRAAIAEYQYELQQLRSDQGEMDHDEVAIRAAEVEQLETDRTELNNLIAAESAKAEVLEQERADQAASHQARVDELRSTIAASRKVLSELAETAAPVPSDDFREEIEKLAAESEAIEAEIRRCTSQRAAERAEADEKLERISQHRESLEAKIRMGREKLDRFALESPEDVAPQIQAGEAELRALTDDHFKVKAAIAEARESAELREQQDAERLAVMEQQIATLKSRIENDSQSLADMATDQSPAPDTELEDEIRILSKESAALQAELKQRTDARAAAQLAADERRKALSQKRDALIERIATERRQLSLFPSEADEGVSDAEALEAEVSSLRAQRVRVENKVAETQAAAELVERERAERVLAYQNETAELRNEIAAGEEALSRLIESSVPDEPESDAALVAEVDELNTELRALKTQVGEQSARNEEAKQRARVEQERMTAERDALRHAVETVQHQLHQLKATTTVDHTTLEIRHAEVASLSSERESIERQLGEARRNAAQSERAAAEAQVAHAQQVDELKQCIQNQRAEVESLNSDRESADRQVVDARAAVEAGQRAATEAQAVHEQRVAELQGQVEAQRAEVESLISEQAAVERRLVEARVSAEQRKCEAAEAQSAHEQQVLEITQQTARYQTELESLNSERESVDRQVADARTAFDERQRAAAEAKTVHEQRVTELQQLIEAQRTEVESLSSQRVAETVELEAHVRKLADQAQSIRLQVEAEKEAAAARTEAARRRESELDEQRERLEKEVFEDREELVRLQIEVTELPVVTDKAAAIERLVSQRHEVADQLADAREKLAAAAAAKKLAEAERKERDAEAAILQAAVTEDWKQIKAIANELRDLEKAEDPADAVDLQQLRTEREKCRQHLEKAKVAHARRKEVHAQAVHRAEVEAERLQSEIAADEIETQAFLAAPVEASPPLSLNLLPDSDRVSPVARMKLRDSGVDDVSPKKSKGRSTSKLRKSVSAGGTSRRKMISVCVGLYVLSLTFIGLAGGAGLASILSASGGEAGRLWGLFFQYAQWIIPALWITGLLLCAAVPSRSEARGVCVASLGCVVVVLTCVGLSSAGITGWVWVTIGVAAALHAYLLESFLAELSTFAQFRRSEKACETLMSATTVGCAIAAVTALCWIFGAPERVQAITVGLTKLVVLGVATALSVLLFRVGQNAKTELTRGRWAHSNRARPTTR